MARTAKPAAGDNNGRKGGTEDSKGKGVLVPDNMGATKAALQHSAYLTVEWTPEEQSVVDELLVKYASKSKMYCYVQIARQLKDKYLRDVVLRCRWMNGSDKTDIPYGIAVWKNIGNLWLHWKIQNSFCIIQCPAKFGAVYQPFFEHLLSDIQKLKVQPVLEKSKDDNQASQGNKGHHSSMHNLVNVEI
ncbi:hypothetical protein HAX54_015430 [Datura stramonium]|uniref:Uncharacterized protein n=1 Tax=Datura stramonium TaxID=4076 RepID=A0ABS8TSY9_DATST|nr:hypothetical protein [Datura stramonium]